MRRAIVAVALAALVGCGQKSDIDRGIMSNQYAAAMAAYQAGQMDAAIAGFEKVIKAEPGNAEAHFQLATLLDEVKRDYAGAVAHYRMYGILSENSDKSPVAKNRMMNCLNFYGAELVAKNRSKSGSSAALELLKKEHAECGKVKEKLQKELDEANRKILSQQREIELKVKMFNDMVMKMEEGNARKTETGAAEETSARKPIRLTDKELLEDDEDEDRVLKSDDVKRLRAEMDAEDAEGENVRPKVDAKKKTSGGLTLPWDNNAKTAKKRTIPETYVVQEGDTLMRISARFYGTNHKWRAIRDANRTIISSDGRVKTGQEIRLP